MKRCPTVTESIHSSSKFTCNHERQHSRSRPSTRSHRLSASSDCTDRLVTKEKIECDHFRKYISNRKKKISNKFFQLL